MYGRAVRRDFQLDAMAGRHTGVYGHMPRKIGQLVGSADPLVSVSELLDAAAGLSVRAAGRPVAANGPRVGPAEIHGALPRASTDGLC